MCLRRFAVCIMQSKTHADTLTYGFVLCDFWEAFSDALRYYRVQRIQYYLFEIKRKRANPILRTL